MDDTIDILVDLDLPEIPWGKPVFPRLEAAVATIAGRVHNRWKAYASGAPLPSGQTIRSTSGAYNESIRLRALTPLRWQVSSDLSYASAIEYGTRAYDMKKALESSRKVRVVKHGANRGKRYLIIPFQHGTPGTVGFGKNVMPPAIHDMARDLDPSRIIGSTRRPAGNMPPGQRATVHQNLYQWGYPNGRLPAGLAPKLKASHATDPYAGMVKFQSDRGGSKDTRYLTFRVMMEGGKGWIKPAQPGKYPLKSALDAYRDIADKAFRAAVQADVEEALHAAGLR